MVLGHAFLQPGEWGRFKGLPVRRDVAKGLIDQGITVLRYGGSMVNNGGYKWKKMIGPRYHRPPYAGTWYNGRKAVFVGDMADRGPRILDFAFGAHHGRDEQRTVRARKSRRQTLEEASREAGAIRPTPSTFQLVAYFLGLEIRRARSRFSVPANSFWWGIIEHVRNHAFVESCLVAAGWRSFIRRVRSGLPTSRRCRSNSSTWASRRSPRGPIVRPRHFSRRRSSSTRRIKSATDGLKQVKRADEVLLVAMQEPKEAKPAAPATETPPPPPPDDVKATLEKTQAAENITRQELTDNIEQRLKTAQRLMNQNQPEAAMNALRLGLNVIRSSPEVSEDVRTNLESRVQAQLMSVAQAEERVVAERATHTA